MKYIKVVSDCTSSADMGLVMQHFYFKRRYNFRVRKYQSYSFNTVFPAYDLVKNVRNYSAKVKPFSNISI